MLRDVCCLSFVVRHDEYCLFWLRRKVCDVSKGKRLKDLFCVVCLVYEERKKGYICELKLLFYVWCLFVCVCVCVCV